MTPPPVALYAFENGLDFGTDAEESAFLKQTGYAGVSQVNAAGEALGRKAAAYEKEGLRVLSVYRDRTARGCPYGSVRKSKKCCGR